MVGAIATVAATAVKGGAVLGDTPQPGLDACADQWLGLLPETATALGLDKGNRALLRHRLNDRSREAVGRQAAVCREWLAKLPAVGVADVRTDNDIDIATMRAGLALGRDGAAFPYGDNSFNAAMSEGVTPYLVNQMMGDWQAVPEFLKNQHPLDSADDAEAYLSRLQQFGEALDAESARVREDADHGSILPQRPLQTLIAALTNARDEATADSGLIKSISARATQRGIKGPFGDRAKTIMATSVQPALARQLATMETLRPASPEEPGVWRLAWGEDYYAWALKVGTGTSMSAKEVHQVGLEECRELSARIDRQLRGLGLSQGSVGARLSALAKDPASHFPDTDEGRSQIIAYVQSRIDTVRPLLRRAFKRQPDVSISVRRIPPNNEGGGATGYMVPGPLDGSKPSTFFINLRDTSDWPRWIIPTLAYHETIPGHAWQAAYLSASRKLPAVRGLLQFNAYMEGWALYGEQLSEELGAYDGDDLGRLGHAQNQLFRAGRLVVDTGIHTERWTREQSARWMMNLTGHTRGSVLSEIDRYTVAPGQGCGYKIGHDEFLRLRGIIRSQTGSHFDLAAFNDRVLRTGPTSFDILQAAVENATFAGT